MRIFFLDLQRLPRAWWFALLIAMAGVAAAMGFSYVAELNRAHSVTEGNLRYWAPELADIFAHKDWLRLSKLGRTFATPPVKSLVFKDGDRTVFSFPMESDDMTCARAERHVIQQYGAAFGTVDICLDTKMAISRAAESPLFLVISLSLFFIIGFAAIFPVLAVRRGLSSMVDFLADWSKSTVSADAPSSTFPVLANQASVEGKLHALVQDLVRSRLESERKALRDEIVRDVAHNLGSPIASLAIQIHNLAGLSLEQKSTLNSGLAQVNAIVSKLRSATRITAARAAPEFKADLPAPTKVEMLSPLLESILNEKRIEKANRSDVSLDFDLSPSGYGAFAAVNALDFRAVISNLLNNAYEAIEGSGQIAVMVTVSDTKVEISIQDSGRGIPEAIQADLFTEGFTFGKPGGNGRGLFHAKKTLSTWNGQISMESAPGHGAKAVVSLPLANRPSWFIPKLDLSNKDTVVVLDDDLSISCAWKMKLKHKRFLSFAHPDQFKAWLSSNRHLISESRVLFLVDLRLGDSLPSGLDVIEAERIAEAAVLVTSDADQETIQKRCSFLGAMLLWKAEIAQIQVI